MNHKGAWVSLLAIAVLVTGCSPTDDDGVDQVQLDKAQAPLIAAAKRTQGYWAQLTEEERDLFLKRTRGNLAAAQQMALFMSGKSPMGTRGP